MAERTKRCGKCGKTKPRKEFSRNRSAKDGLQGRCKACYRAWHEANREARAERQRAWREANRERIAEHRAANREAKAEYDRAYRAANRERIAEHRRANREAIAERERAYRKANAEKIAKRMREYGRESLAASRSAYRRRFRKIHNTEPEVVDEFTRGDLIEKWGDECWYRFTGCTGGFDHVDHLVPVKQRGEHTPANCRPACSACNVAKDARGLVWVLFHRGQADLSEADDAGGRTEAAQGPI